MVSLLFLAGALFLFSIFFLMCSLLLPWMIGHWKGFLLGWGLAAFGVVLVLFLLQGDRVLSLLLGHRVVFFGHEFIQVESVSMEKTLYPGDVMLVDTAFSGPLCVGDVVVFHVTPDYSRLLVKRVAGVENEVVRYTGDGLVIGEGLGRLAIAHKNTSVRGELRVPKASVFLLGDNYAASEDSRIFGAVPTRDIVGKVAYLVSPIQFSSLRRPQDPAPGLICIPKTRS